MLIPFERLACDAGLFFGCEPDQLAQLIAGLNAQEVHFQNGETIARQGDQGDRFWLIERGRVDVLATIEGRRTRLLTRGPLDLVGEGATTRPGEIRSADLVCAAMTSVYELRLASIQALPIPLQSVFWRSVASALNKKLVGSVADRVWQANALDGYVVQVNRFANKHALLRAVPGRDTVMAREEQAVIWFSDVEGFSAFARERDPGEVGDAIRQMMDIQTGAIESRGGHIDKYIGDGLMAYWIAEEENQIPQLALHATEAAFDARQKILALEKGFGLRIGLHAGECVSGNFGSNSRYGFTLIGDNVNSAARYEQARTDIAAVALPQLRVSEVVFGHLPPNMQSMLAMHTRFADKHGREFPVFAGPA